MKSPHSPKSGIQVLLEGTKTWLAGWPRGHCDAILVECARKSTLLCAGESFSQRGRCLIRDTLKYHLKGVLWKADDCWKPLCCRSLVSGELPVLGDPAWWAYGNRERKPFPPAMSLQRPLLRELQCQLAKNYLKDPDPFSQSSKKGEFGAEK